MSPTDAPIRTALIGYGFAGKTFHVPLLHATEGLALTHVVSSRPDAVHADLPDVVVVPDVDALLACHDVDLVVIAAGSPPGAVGSTNTLRVHRVGDDAAGGSSAASPQTREPVGFWPARSPL